MERHRGGGGEREREGITRKKRGECREESEKGRNGKWETGELGSEGKERSERERERD